MSTRPPRGGTSRAEKILAILAWIGTAIFLAALFAVPYILK